MPGCSASPAIRPGESCSHLLHGRAALDVGERDQPEVPRREDDHVGLGGRVGPARLCLLVRKRRAEHDVAVDDPVAGGDRQHLAESTVLVTDGFGQRPVEVAPALGRHLGDRDVDVGLDQGVDEILQRPVVALEERRPLGLAVVGQDHHVIGPWRVRDRVLEAGELSVEPPQRVQRRGSEQPGVVGDLVVADEVRVGRGNAPVHVAHQRVDREIAQRRGGRPPAAAGRSRLASAGARPPGAGYVGGRRSRARRRRRSA